MSSEFRSGAGRARGRAPVISGQRRLPVVTEAKSIPKVLLKEARGRSMHSRRFVLAREPSEFRSL